MLTLAILLLTAPDPDRGEPPVIAPFTDVDTLAINDWWNRPTPKNAQKRIIDLKVPRDEVVCFGIYTVAQDRGAGTGTLKLTAQLFPLYPDETRTVRLEKEVDGQWQEIATQDVNDIGWSTTFRVEDWPRDRDVRYRLRHGEAAEYVGTVRKDPPAERPFTFAALSCNSSRDRGMRENYVRNINHQDPDFVFYAGDQSYDHRQHTAAWLKFGLQFRDTFRDRPCVTIPDDHDIGQPNLWGESGKVSTLKGNADGGYQFHPEYVKMVERQQCGHLPDPVDPEPIGQGIGVYFTRLIIGDVDFAIIEDRKFKSGPAGKIPQMGPRPDHVNDPSYDPSTIDLPGLTLLGERQLVFLKQWAGDQSPAFKVVLSQTGFCGGAHLHGPKAERLFADLDSNGWPQTGRDKAVRLIKQAGAIHVAGDQHLATVIQHGVDEFRDGPWHFVVPATVNSIYERWWHPEGEAAGGDPPDSPLPWVGDYTDGFGNKISMQAYANPDQSSQGGGYGLIRLDPDAETATFEAWPRDADLTQDDAKQFIGWPVTVKPSRD